MDYDFAIINENILLTIAANSCYCNCIITITALFARSRHRIVIPLELTRVQSTEDSVRARTKRQNPGD